MTVLLTKEETLKKISKSHCIDHKEGYVELEDLKQKSTIITDEEIEEHCRVCMDEYGGCHESTCMIKKLKTLMEDKQ